MDILSLFLCSIPFLIPAAIGLYLVVIQPSELSLMAGLLTLKPILATPIWWLTFFMQPEPNLLLSVCPGVGLTVLIVVSFWDTLSGPNAGKVRVLLALDCARWLNSFLLLSLSSGSGIMGMGGGVVCIFALIGLALPSIFAVVALTLSMTSAREFSGQRSGERDPETHRRL